MKIVFIGAGNLATQLAKVLKSKPYYNIVQIYSRTEESAKELAQRMDCRYTSKTELIDADADVYFFAVKDSVLSDLINQMPFNNGLWLHTAGSIPLDVFAKKASDYGVFYPFQTFSKTRDVDFSAIPIFIEANNTDSLAKIKNIAESISDSVTELSSSQRQYIHLTGVFACNFVNHLYHISENIMKENGLSFDKVLPLIEETARKVETLLPADAQTGPAVRMDRNVMDKHLSLLKDENLKDIYKLMSESIFKMNNKE